MSAAMLDHLDVLEIRLHAAKRANERIPLDGEHRLADFINRDDYRHGIRRAFSEVEGFEEWMVSPLLDAFYRTEAFESDVADFASGFLSSLWPPARPAPEAEASRDGSGALNPLSEKDQANG
jgi:hypothetical protein